MLNSRIGKRLFQIAHVPLRVISRDHTLLQWFDNWLSDYIVPPEADDDPVIRLTVIGLDTGSPLPFRVPDEAVLTFENETAKYFSYRGLWIAEFHPTGIMIINRVSNKITGFAYRDLLLESDWGFEDFLHPLYELIRQQHLYPCHAASVSWEGHGLMLMGKSGMGKSTLSTDLIHHGFDFLSDDRCFVRQTNEGLEMFGFYEPFKLFASNIAHIPELRKTDAAMDASSHKNDLDVRLHYPRQVILHSRIDGVLFPYWSPGEKSRLESIPPGQALLEMLPLTMVCFDAASSRAHFDFCGRFVRQVPAAKLILGDDRSEWHVLAKDFIMNSRRRQDGLSHP